MVNIVYFDSINGKDNVDSNGSENNPFKTLDYFVDNYAIKSGQDYYFKLSAGEYSFQQTTFQYFQNCKIEVCGEKEKTVLNQVKGIFTNGSGGSNTFTLTFKRLVYNISLTLTDPNLNGAKWTWNFENVVFNQIPNNSHAILSANAPITIKNCVKVTNTSNFLRKNSTTISVMDSYGAFTSGYATVQTDWDISGNTITSTPSLDSIYNRNDGIKTNGVYSGTSSWELKKISPYFTIRYLIELSDGDYCSIIPMLIKNENSIPKMTSNISPSGRAFASTIYAPGYDAWYAFNQKDDSEGYATKNSKIDGFLGYEFVDKKLISKYIIRSGSASYLSEMPKDWTFEGSDDGIIWNVLDTRTNESWSTANTDKEYVFKNSTVYKMYRINFTKNNGSVTCTSINEFKMYEVELQKVVFIKDLSEDKFINYGMIKNEEINLKGINQEKRYLNDNSYSLGSGKVFKQLIDTSKMSIKNVTIT